MIPVIKILEYYFVDILINDPHSIYVRCCCPFHKGTGKSPNNFSINRINGYWTCFNGSCPAKSGSIIRFISLQEECKWSEAKEILKGQFAPKNVSWRTLRRAMLHEKKPTHGPLPVVNWPRTMEQIPRNHPWIKKRDYKAKDFRPFKVGYDCLKPAYIPFPVYFRGKLRGFTSRDIRKDPIRKWEHDYGLPRRRVLYNYDRASETNYVFICEGPLDVIRLNTLGYTGAVAVFGSKTTTEQIALILETWDKVVVSFDGDEAGNIGADKLCESLKDHVNFCAKLSLPDETDVDDLRSRKGLLSHIKERLTVEKAIKKERSWDELRKQWS